MFTRKPPAASPTSTPASITEIEERIAYLSTLARLYEASILYAAADDANAEIKSLYQQKSQLEVPHAS